MLGAVLVSQMPKFSFSKGYYCTVTIYSIFYSSNVFWAPTLCQVQDHVQRNSGRTRLGSCPLERHQVEELDIYTNDYSTTW